MVEQSMRLRQPEYTGENRCYPCTAVNVVLSVFFAVVLASALYLLTASFVVASLTGTVFLFLALTSVWLRGYLVPGTPTLTKRYMPEKVLALFGKADAGRATGAGARTEDETEAEAKQVETFLTEAGAVEFSEDIDDLVLTQEFEREWNDEIRRVDENPDADEVLAEIGFDPDDERIERYDGAVAVRDWDAEFTRWPSPTALRVDMAGARLLSRHPDWDGYTPEERATVLRSLRIFLEDCPDCGDIDVSHDTVESCCSVRQVVVLTCSETGDRLMEQEV